MFKKSFFCLCMFFIGSILIINSAFALTLGFNPNAQTVILEKYATVDLTIDTLDVGIITGFDVMVSYNSDILSITADDIEVDPNLGGKVLESSAVDIYPDLDLIYINGIYKPNGDSGITQPQFLSLAELNFLAIDEGTSDLKYSSISLLKVGEDTFFEINSDFIDEIADDGSITVLAASQTIPEPATFLLLGTLLVGFCFFKRKEI